MNDMYFGREAAWYEARKALITAREIDQQPRLWRQLVGLMKAQSAEIEAFVARMKAIEGLRVIFTGAGSSAFIGEVLQMMLGENPGLRTEAIATTDIVSAPHSVLFDVPTLLVSFSRSGESPESMAALQYSANRVKELYNLVVVCKKGSSLANCAEVSGNTLILDMPPESSDAGFAMTSSVSCMALGTYCVFNWDRRDAIFAMIETLADEVEAEITAMDELARQVVEFGYDRLIYLGSSGLKGLAQEGSVKSLELTNGKVNASYDSSMGFRHGPKTVINNSTLTVHFVSPLALTSRYDLDFVKEVVREKRENRVCVVAPSTVQVPDGVDYSYSYALPGGAFAEITAYIKGLVFMQLLSVEKSLATGTPTDNPSVGGEVNRVVQGVTIYPLD